MGTERALYEVRGRSLPQAGRTHGQTLGATDALTRSRPAITVIRQDLEGFGDGRWLR